MPEPGAPRASGASAPEVLVGVVGKPVGLRGEVYVRPDADLPAEVFSAGRVLQVRATAGETPAGAGAQDAQRARPGTLRITATRLHGGRRVVRFAGVDTREEAEELRHLQLTLPRRDIDLGPDAFWTTELLGREVVDDSGAVVGVLEGVADGTAHDYLVVARPDGGELLIPAVAELVTISADVVVVTAIPGLLDQEG